MIDIARNIVPCSDKQDMKSRNGSYFQPSFSTRKRQRISSDLFSELPQKRSKTTNGRIWNKATYSFSSQILCTISSKVIRMWASFTIFVPCISRIIQNGNMKYGVNRKVLLITAGVVWIIAGANILRIGIMTWLTDSQYWLFKIGEATVVFLLFFLFVFKRLYYKHTKRIGEKKKEKNCPFSFFDVKGWIIMVFMITFGVTMRSFHILPDAFISVFYTGLSLALIFTGVLFIRYWWINRKGNLFTPPPEE